MSANMSNGDYEKSENLEDSSEIQDLEILKSLSNHPKRSTELCDFLRDNSQIGKEDVKVDFPNQVSDSEADKKEQIPQKKKQVDSGEMGKPKQTLKERRK